MIFLLDSFQLFLSTSQSFSFNLLSVEMKFILRLVCTCEAEKKIQKIQQTDWKKQMKATPMNIFCVVVFLLLIICLSIFSRVGVCKVGGGVMMPQSVRSSCCLISLLGVEGVWSSTGVGVLGEFKGICGLDGDWHSQKDIKMGQKQEYYFRFRISAQKNPRSLHHQKSQHFSRKTATEHLGNKPEVQNRTFQRTQSSETRPGFPSDQHLTQEDGKGSQISQHSLTLTRRPKGTTHRYKYTYSHRIFCPHINLSISISNSILTNHHIPSSLNKQIKHMASNEANIWEEHWFILIKIELMRNVSRERIWNSDINYLLTSGKKIEFGLSVLKGLS
ncbi:putative signal peptide protein [Puccinia sorghi]|uniref:Putative signal peptide protein n=1 Tax=Puccinia sorghi TaxID=27349 RepID=A0A0L6UQ77_9BASI|nr:putative signal peptide protein [Puccinia sorghi]